MESRTLSQPISYANQEEHCYRALTSCYSFGRYESDLDWRKWSCFSQNRCLEEVQKLSKPGTVAAMKAYFEACHERFAYNKKSAAVLPNQQNEGKVVEDGGKDDMSIDCPDELVSYDGTHGRVNVADNSEETIGTNLNKSDNGKDGGELEPLRAMLGKSVVEKETFAPEYEAERNFFLQGLANLHYQLNALSSQGSLVNENDGGFINNYDSGMWEGEKSVVTDGQLQDMIYDCSKFVKHVLDERSQTQSTISELYSIINKKDQEIHELSARINESPVQQDTEAIADRVLNCLVSASNQEEQLDESFTQKMFHIEKSTIHLIEKYNSFLSESNLLGQCITNVRPDHIVQDDMGSIFLIAREELLELRRKEVELTQKLTELEEKNWKLREELKRGSVIIDTANAEIVKIKAELEHEKARCNNTKEKFNLAVTKGKSVVQQRDSLKKSLADKTNELEKCFIEIQENSSAPEAAEELCKQELVKCEILAAMLQGELSERTTIIENCGRVLFESHLPEEPKAMDILGKVQWLANENNKLMGKLQDVTVITTEAANNEIERLTALSLAESHEKHHLQEELKNLRYRCDGMVEKEHQNSLEKDRTVRLLHEAYGISMDSAEGLPSDLVFMIDRFLGKTKEKTSFSIGSSHPTFRTCLHTCLHDMQGGGPAEEGHQIMGMYEDKKGQEKVKVRWFHHNQEVKGVVSIGNSHPKEVFITPNAQVISGECVDGSAIVVTREHYDKFLTVLPQGVIDRNHLCYRQFKSNRVKPFKMSKLCGYFDQPIFSYLEHEFLEDDDNKPQDNVKVGSKRTRSCRGRELVSYKSSGQNMKYGQRKLIRSRYARCPPLETPIFKANDKIELLCQDSDIRCCWFRCTILEVSQKKLRVRYDDLKEEDGSGNLEEWIPAFRRAEPDKLGMRHEGRPIIRPALSHIESHLALVAGAHVDAWWQPAQNLQYLDQNHCQVLCFPASFIQKMFSGFTSQLFISFTQCKVALNGLFN